MVSLVVAHAACMLGPLFLSKAMSGAPPCNPSPSSSGSLRCSQVAPAPARVGPVPCSHEEYFLRA